MTDETLPAEVEPLLAHVQASFIMKQEAHRLIAVGSSHKSGKRNLKDVTSLEAAVNSR